MAAPAGKIYEALTDWTLRSKWRRGIEITWEGDPLAFVNQRVTFQVKGRLLPYSFSFRISGLEPPRRVYMEYLGKTLRGRAAVEIVPEETGCRVDFHWMKVEPAGLLSKVYFALGLGMRTHRRRTIETLRLLKEHLEGTKL
jgi:uncharacterized protein YndB with AHSA1/START domain